MTHARVWIATAFVCTSVGLASPANAQPAPATAEAPITTPEPEPVGAGPTDAITEPDDTSAPQKPVEPSLDNGGYGGLGIMMSPLGDALGLLNGVHGSWIIDHRFSVGIFGYGISNYPMVNVQGNDARLNGGYGGFSFQATAFSDFPIHPTASVMIGAGGFHLEFETPYIDADYSAIMLWHPTLGFELNAFSWLHLNLEAGQRFMLRNKLDGIGDGKLNGYTFGCIIKFGSF